MSQSVKVIPGSSERPACKIPGKRPQKQRAPVTAHDGSWGTKVAIWALVARRHEAADYRLWICHACCWCRVLLRPRRLCSTGEGRSPSARGLIPHLRYSETKTCGVNENGVRLLKRSRPPQRERSVRIWCQNNRSVCADASGCTMHCIDG